MEKNDAIDFIIQLKLKGLGLVRYLTHNESLEKEVLSESIHAILTLRKAFFIDLRDQYRLNSTEAQSVIRQYFKIICSYLFKNKGLEVKEKAMFYFFYKEGIPFDEMKEIFDLTQTEIISQFFQARTNFYSQFDFLKLNPEKEEQKKRDCVYARNFSNYLESPENDDCVQNFYMMHLKTCQECQTILKWDNNFKKLISNEIPKLKIKDEDREKLERQAQYLFDYFLSESKKVKNLGQKIYDKALSFINI